MSSNLIIYLLSLLFICFDFENVLCNIYFFFTFFTLEIRDLKSRLGQTAKALGLVSFFNTFHHIHIKGRLRAVSYFSLESQWTDSTEMISIFCSPCVVLREEGRPLALYKKVLFRAWPVELLFTFCPNLSNCQSECEVCCSDRNVIPNLSIQYCTKKISLIETDWTLFRKPVHSTLQAEVSLLHGF